MLNKFLAPFNGKGSARDITSFVVIAATMLIGAYILGQFIEAMPSLNGSNPFASLIETLSATIGNGYNLLVIVIIVIAAMIIIGYLSRIQ